ncbi:MAG: AsmA family protein [Thermodesulfobacteriota bacterium]
MKTVFKILAAIIGVILLITAGLSVFVHYYLTDKRIKELVVPKMENALAREVRLGDIQISLWKGLTLKNFAIMEADGQDEFIKAESFNLSYDLLPLLKKKLKISQVVLSKPRIKVVRYASGKFNFETLKPLTSTVAEKKTGSIESSPGSADAAFPFALAVSEIRINRADLIVRDELKEIPAVTAAADCSVSLAAGRDLASLEYRGRLDISAEVLCEAVETALEGGISFDRNKADFSFDLQVEDQRSEAGGQKMCLYGTVKDYLVSPDITCNLDSRSLNLDCFLADLGSVDKKKDKVADRSNGGNRADKNIGQSIGAGLPEGIKAQGEVRVTKAEYSNLWINDLRLDYELRRNMLYLNDLSAYTAEGRIAGQAAVDLDKLEPDYNVTLAIRGMQLAPLQRGLFPKTGERISGNLTVDFGFHGTGFQWPALADALNGQGTYKLLEGRIHQVEILAAIATLFQEKRLEDIYYEELSGNFRIKNGDVLFRASLDSEQLGIDSEGIIGLDGELAAPLELNFAPELSSRLELKTSLSKYMVQKDGAAKFKLYLTGSLTSPEVSPYTAAAHQKIEERLADTIKDRAGKEIDRVSDQDKQEKGDSEKQASPEEVVNDFIRGVLGN